jgi:hypothetical protein
MAAVAVVAAGAINFEFVVFLMDREIHKWREAICAR